MRKAKTTLVAEVFEFDSRSPAYEAMMHARRGFIQPFLRLHPAPHAVSPNGEKTFVSRLLSVPFQLVQVRDDLGCDLFMRVNVPRWQLWLLGKRLPLLLVTTALLAISGSLVPLLVR